MTENIKMEIDKAAKDYKETKDDYKYIAFISYRHLQPDATVAKNIHTMIETFKLPKEFYENGSKPNFRVFRDREELTTTSLSESINEALRTSKYLIVICSKRLQESMWCNIEVETFVKLHGVSRVIPVLIEGEPEDSFPKILLESDEKVVLEDGTVEVQNKDILAAELRPEEVKNKGFEGYAELESSNPAKLKDLTNQSVKLLNEEKYRIMATILGVTYGDLRQRDKLRKQRQLLTLSGIIGAALLFFGIFMFRAYQSENLAKRQTIQDKSAFMMDRSRELLNKGDRFKSMIVANKAMEVLDEDMEEYENLKSRHSELLSDSVNVTTSVYDKTINTENEFTFVAFTKDGSEIMAGIGNDSIGKWQLSTGNILNSVKGHEQQVKVVDLSKDEKILVSGGFDGNLVLWNREDFSMIKSKNLNGNVMLVEFSQNDKHLHVIIESKGVHTYRRMDPKTLEDVSPEIILDMRIKRVLYDNAGDFMWVLYGNEYSDKRNTSLIKYDLVKGEKVKAYEDQKFMEKDVLSINSENAPLVENFYPYTDFKMSNDGKFIYLLTRRNLRKINIENDEIVFETDKVSQSDFNDRFLLREKKSGDEFYVCRSLTLEKYNSNTGELISKSLISEESIQDFAISSDGKTIAVLEKNGNIDILIDDVVVEKISAIDKVKIDYIYLPGDGKNLVSLSLTNGKIYISNLQEKDPKQLLDAQIAATSYNNKFALLRNPESFYIYDIANAKKVRDVKHEYFDRFKKASGSSNYYRISDDGKYLAGIANKGTPDLPEFIIFVLDSESEQIVYEFEYQFSSFFYTISADAKTIAISSGNNKFDIHSVEEKKLIREIESESSYIQSIGISPDNKYVLINLQEGLGEFYQISDGKKIFSVPGEVLEPFVIDEEGLKFSVLYNNIFSKYKNFEKDGEDIHLSPVRTERGLGLKDQNYINPKKNLILTIISQGKNHHFYLLDTKTGDLRKSFSQYLSDYAPAAILAPDGNSILFDYGNQGVSSGSESGSYLSTPKMIILPIYSYEDLVDKSKEILKDVKLTKEELEELKIEENK